MVARVDGAPILRQDVLHQMRSGQDRRAALDALIDTELLARAAQRKQLQDHPEVVRARRRALANLLVERNFLDNYGESEIPGKLVAKAYKLNRRHYVRPELVEVTHIVVLANRKMEPAQHAKAKQIASRVHRAATAKQLSETEFKQLADTLAAEAHPIKLKAESLITPLRGSTVAPFADAAFALTRPGEVSPVVDTRYGYHVIYYRGRLPERDTSLADAEDEIRTRILDDARQLALQGLLRELRKRFPVKIDHARLQRALARADD